MTRKIPPIVLNLLIINGLFFLATYVLGSSMSIDLNKILGLHYFDSSLFEPYQIITSMFCHGNLTHLLFNMFALWMFGTVIEHKMGSVNFLKFYLLCGLGATALHMGVQAFEVYNITESFTNNFTISSSSINFHEVFSEENKNILAQVYLGGAVGASGALYGMLIAFGMFFPEEKLMLIFLPMLPIKAKYFIPAMIAIDFYLGLANYSWDPIAHYAHLGGALFGFLLIKFWFQKRSHA
jgi:rhomboid-like protein